MELIIIASIATFFNFVVIMWKINRERYFNASLDAAIFVAICFLFQGTIQGLQIGMIASAMVSIYLIFYDVKIPEI